MENKKFDQVFINEEITTIANAEAAKNIAAAFKKANAKDVLDVMNDLSRTGRGVDFLDGWGRYTILHASVEVFGTAGHRPQILAVFILADDMDYFPDEFRRISAQFDIDVDSLEFGADYALLFNGGTIVYVTSYERKHDVV